ncbi:small ribosomal subunit protein uS3m-like [Tubulanus polymorphus]|uniref:small ribosomal subunit protein uS3m-like n=1 Tax=Tubulanus polymorphus TaxID=672921 RepID=UPI003DA37323
MAAPMREILGKKFLVNCFSQWNLARSLHISAACQKNIRSGIPKGTINKSRALTYEEAQPPHRIGLRKSWNSWNTSSLKDEGENASQLTVEDAFIRKFIHGTWSRLFLSEVIIKRRHNMIICAGLVFRGVSARKMYFLLGYTESMLEYLLKCPVKLEIQTVESRKDVVFKYI